MEVVYFEITNGDASPTKARTFKCHLCRAVHTNFSAIQRHYLRDHENVAIILHEDGNKASIRRRFVGPKSRMPKFWLNFIMEEEARAAETIQGEIQDFFAKREDISAYFPIIKEEPDDIQGPLEPWPTFSEILGDGYFDASLSFDEDVFATETDSSNDVLLCTNVISTDEEVLEGISPFALDRPCDDETQCKGNESSDTSLANDEALGNLEDYISWEDVQIFLTEASDQPDPAKLFNETDGEIEPNQTLPADLRSPDHIPIKTEALPEMDVGSSLDQYIQSYLISPIKVNSDESPSLDISHLFQENMAIGSELNVFLENTSSDQVATFYYESESNSMLEFKAEESAGMDRDPFEDSSTTNKENVDVIEEFSQVLPRSSAKQSTRKRPPKRKWHDTTTPAENGPPATKFHKENGDAGPCGIATPDLQTIEKLPEPHGIHTTPRHSRYSNPSGSRVTQIIRRRSLRFMKKAQQFFPTSE